MKRPLPSASRRIRLGLAVGADTVTALAVRGGEERVYSVPLARVANGALAAELGRAFAEVNASLAAQLGAPLTGAVTHMALLPPLADVRVLTLPPLRPAEAAAVVRRDAGRYFLAVPEPRVTAVLPRRGTAPLLAGAASAAVVEQARAAAQAAGWRVASIVPAHAAWLAGAPPSATAVIGIHEGTAHVIRVEGGVPMALRRVPARAADEVVQAVSRAGEPDMPTQSDGSVVVYGDAEEREHVMAALSAAGCSAAPSVRTAEEAAAAGAADAALELVPDTVSVERRGTERRAAAWLAAAAVVLLIGAGLLQRWDAQRELRTVQQRRAAIRADVEPLLELRATIDQLDAAAVEVEALARRTPRWTHALLDLALLLPPDAHVTRLFATGDTLVIDAEGGRAGESLQALRGAGSLRDARLLGAVERELEDGATTIERFRLSARLAGASHAPPAAPPAAQTVQRAPAVPAPEPRAAAARPNAPAETVTADTTHAAGGQR